MDKLKFFIIKKSLERLAKSEGMTIQVAAQRVIADYYSSEEKTERNELKEDLKRALNIESEEDVQQTLKVISDIALGISTEYKEEKSPWKLNPSEIRNYTKAINSIVESQPITTFAKPIRDHFKLHAILMFFSSALEKDYEDSIFEYNKTSEVYYFDARSGKIDSIEKGALNNLVIPIFRDKDKLTLILSETFERYPELEQVYFNK